MSADAENVIVEVPVRDVCAAVQAASLADEYEVAVALLTNAKLDLCFYCARSARKRKRGDGPRMYIRCLGPGSLTGVDLKYINTNTCDPQPFGWVHREGCASKIKLKRSNKRTCAHSHVIRSQ